MVTRLTLRTHDLPQLFGVVSGKIKARSPSAFVRLIAYFIDFYRQKLFNEHWGETVHFGHDDSLEFSMLSHGLEVLQVKETCQSFFEWVSALPSSFTVVSPLGSRVADSRDWWNVEVAPWFTLDQRENVSKHHG